MVPIPLRLRYWRLTVKPRAAILVLLLVLVGCAIAYLLTHRPHGVIITGIVTTDAVIVSSEIQGRLEKLQVREGDAVKRGDLLAVIRPQEWKADLAFFANGEGQWQAQVSQAQADLKYQEARTSNQIRQAEANLAASQAQVQQAVADLENAKLTFQREEDLYRRGVDAPQAFDQARTAYDSAKARVESFRKQEQASEAAVALAKSNAEQVAAQRAVVEASQRQLAAAAAQKEKAEVRLGYTEIRAPIEGLIDTRAALSGEVVNPGQGIVTLIDPDNLWVRADVEEGLIDRVRLGQKMQVRLPSGATREGVVFFRGVDADYATQRDVSRTKRDIKTFEIRLRCDNRDRRLAVGMSAYVTLPVGD
jgi:HlyD family secretion protein